VITKERFHLLERLAERIADEVRHDERLEEVTITVRKLRPPVAVDLASAAVTITRP
jgi:7,8-dihydroneopterin aldolase/epimerase/oxygenase